VNPEKWQSVGCTHTGNIRSRNEDAYLDLPEHSLWAIADGMGGHASGEIASRMIVNNLCHYHQTPLCGKNIRRITQRLSAINTALIEQAALEKVSVIGSTVAILHATRRYCVCLWAGDSRIYRLRNGQLKQLSRDHTHAALLNRFGTNYDISINHENLQALTRAVGADTALQLEVQIQEIFANDLYLLCSDGLNKELSDSEIAEILKSNTIEDGMELLLNSALHKGGRDNITLLILKPEPF